MYTYWLSLGGPCHHAGLCRRTRPLAGAAAGAAAVSDGVGGGAALACSREREGAATSHVAISRARDAAWHSKRPRHLPSVPATGNHPIQAPRTAMLRRSSCLGIGRVVPQHSPLALSASDVCHLAADDDPTRTKPVSVPPTRCATHALHHVTGGPCHLNHVTRPGSSPYPSWTSAKSTVMLKNETVLRMGVWGCSPKVFEAANAEGVGTERVARECRLDERVLLGLVHRSSREGERRQGRILKRMSNEVERIEGDV